MPRKRQSCATLLTGLRLRYEPSAIVYHSVPESRVQKEYFLAWRFGKARADVRELGFPCDAGWRIAGIPLVLFRRLVFCLLNIFTFSVIGLILWR